MKVKFTEYEQSELQLIPGEKRQYKRKPSWHYSPDKTEKWLRDKARGGWVLYKVKNDENEFCFVNREPSDIEYIIDSKRCSSDESFRENLKNGWILLYNGNIDLTIWGHNFGEKPSKPFLRDKNAILKYVRRGILFNFLCLLAAIAVFIPFNSFGIFREMAAFKFIYIAALVILIASMAGNTISLICSFFRLINRK